jgi:hypothetical protein
LSEQTDKPAKASVLQVAKAVMFAFMGIRKRSDLEQDAATLTLAQVIVGGIVGAMLFVLGVMLIVRLIVS